MVRTFLLSCFLLLAVETNAADYPTGIASKAINALGIDLLAKAGKPDENAVLSPYSIQVAMAMTCAGADGVTLAEMKKVLHYPDSEAELHQSFEALRKSLIMLERQSIAHSENPFPTGRTNDPIRLNIADRLFGQTGFRIQPEFLALTREVYDAPFEQLDFRKNPLEATRRINGWVAEKTKQRILDLIPEGTLDEAIRLVIVNAIYLKAPWYTKFDPAATKPLPFYLGSTNTARIPTMTGTRTIGYAKRDGFSLISLPYVTGLQFLVLLPDDPNGLAALEARLSPTLLAEGAKLPAQETIIYLPRLKLEPPLSSMKRTFTDLGMTTPFNGAANFNRMAPRTIWGYLYIHDIFHRALLELDENGTEAIAATAVMVRYGGISPERPRPIVLRIDRPFVFAVQHCSSAACLFLGRVTDPRCGSSAAK